jgi:nucleotide-binding universal stress UspA family protein
MISTVAVGTDGSATADEAVKQAAEIAHRLGAKLVLLSAFQDSAPAGHERVASDVERLLTGGSPAGQGQDIEVQWASSSSARVRTILERSEADLRAAGIECETRADEGDPAEVLIRLAAECGADLLVIGNKGMRRRVLGSVPNTVTHKADCSVLVVKTT